MTPAELPVAVPARWRRVEGTTSFRSPAGEAPATLSVVRLDRPPPPIATVDVDDEDSYDLGSGVVSYTRFGHLDEGRPMVGERWVWEVPDGYVVLTGSVPWEHYAAHCETFEAVAATFRT